MASILRRVANGKHALFSMQRFNHMNHRMLSSQWRAFATDSNKGNNDLNVIVDLCVVPLKNQNGASVSEEIVIIEKLIDESGLSHMMHGYGTNIEGPWDEVFALIKKCHTTLHDKYGIPRISTSIKVGTRTDKASSIKYKIQSVETKM